MGRPRKSWFGQLKQTCCDELELRTCQVTGHEGSLRLEVKGECIHTAPIGVSCFDDDAEFRTIWSENQFF